MEIAVTKREDKIEMGGGANAIQMAFEVNFVIRTLTWIAIKIDLSKSQASDQLQNEYTSMLTCPPFLS